MSKLYRLHGQAGSRIWKPLWCMRELGIVEQAELSDVPIKIGRTVEIFPGEDDKREYYVNNVNPNGRMPALEDLEKGLTLFDSAAINIYLCKKHESELAPKDAAEDALCTQWAVWGGFRSRARHCAPDVRPDDEGRGPEEGEDHGTVGQAGAPHERPQHFPRQVRGIPARRSLHGRRPECRVRPGLGPPSAWIRGSHQVQLPAGTCVDDQDPRSATPRRESERVEPPGAL